MKNKRRPSKSIYKTLPALLILFAIYTIFLPRNAPAQNPPAPKIEATKQAEFFGANFREGRNLIDKQEWARAADKFRAALEKYPDHKSADAALYWLAFCYKKQKQFKEADAALDRLLQNFPASTWAGDARVMKMEISAPLAKLSTSGTDKINSTLAQEQFSADLEASVTKGARNDSIKKKPLADITDERDRLSLDRADEIKIAAFQSLLTADPKRAIDLMGEILKPDSKASETLQREILRVWRNPRLFASQTLTSNITKSIGGGKELAALLRETLVKCFQNAANPKIRQEIIYTLAGLADSQTVDYLKKLYAAENDREIKKAIINALSNPANMFYSYYSGGSQKQKAELDRAREQPRKIELDVLLEIIRAEKDIELRRLAFSSLSRFQNWSASEQAVDVMTNLYDAESDEKFKLTIIRALVESKQRRAARKLLDIAKNDKSDKLRLEAIYSLRTSSDPEVLKFLEDLIK